MLSRHMKAKFAPWVFKDVGKGVRLEGAKGQFCSEAQMKGGGDGCMWWL